MTDNKLQQGIEQYHQPKDAADVDLIQAVRDHLNNSGLNNRVTAFYDSNRFIIEARDKNSNAQRFLLNRYWSLQLMTSPKPSTEERFCLIPNGTTEDWLKLFKNKVLPFVIENNLPVKID